MPASGTTNPRTFLPVCRPLGRGCVLVRRIYSLKTTTLAGAALLALAAAPAWAQGPVAGSITDARTGEALPGATILLDGAAIGTTNAAGAFSLSAVPAGAHELRITFLGYEPLVQQVQGQAAAHAATASSLLRWR